MKGAGQKGGMTGDLILFDTRTIIILFYFHKNVHDFDAY